MSREPADQHRPDCRVWTHPGPVDPPEADCTCRSRDWTAWLADWHRQVDTLTDRFTRGGHTA
ncbi:hypothetical protein ACFQE5_22185 [Pseudonocardia hispaniensis]|uniref:Uncharacterized protein n=1 Tax=Pseudonocardia hispaniensis TaxID=904933 RepID=A0ABW1J7R1_9PSEU